MSSVRAVTIGSRGSALALRQTDLVRQALCRVAPELDVTVKTVRTRGDRERDAALASFGGAGVFVRSLEEALLAGEIDLAVHSMKDLPTAEPARLVIAAVPPREDPHDALISSVATAVDDLPREARVGTGSPRRRAQLLRRRPDLAVIGLRGNLDTRLRRLNEGRYDAIVLAAAGLNRLGLADRIGALLPYDVMLPAAGQGALAVQVRNDDDALRAVVAGIDDADTRAAVTAERAFLRALAGGCHVPAGAHAAVADGRLRVMACILSPDGADAVRGTRDGPPQDAEAVGAALAAALLDQGGRALLARGPRESDGA